MVLVRFVDHVELVHFAGLAEPDVLVPLVYDPVVAVGFQVLARVIVMQHVPPPEGLAAHPRQQAPTGD